MSEFWKRKAKENPELFRSNFHGSKSVSDFIHNVDFNFKCLCGVVRAFHIDLLVHPKGYCKCVCGILTEWKTDNGKVRFYSSGGAMGPLKGFP